MCNLIAVASSPTLFHHINSLASGIDVVSGVKPDWGPFSKLGGTAKVVLGVIAAVVLCVSVGTLMVGIGKSKGWVGEQHSTMESSRGKSMLVGGVAGIFLIASMGTLVAIVYSMAV